MIIQLQQGREKVVRAEPEPIKATKATPSIVVLCPQCLQAMRYEQDHHRLRCDGCHWTN